MKTILAPRASAILHDLLLGRDDKRPFLLPANICPIVPITFLKARIPFEFVDISAATLNMDLDQTEALLRSRPAAYGGLLYAHTYGDPFTPQSFFKAIKARWPELLLIDDRCLCQPDIELDPSTAADATLYSTGYAKIVDIGFGGFAFLREDVAYRHHALPFDPAALAQLETDFKSRITAGEPYRYDETDWLQTEADLPDWPSYIERVRAERATSVAHRRSINAVYNSLIPAGLVLAEDFQLWRFNLRLPHPQVLREAIFAAGLFASSHYSSLVHIMGSGSDGNARELAAQVINLFNDHHYSLDMAERTAQIICRSI